MSSSPTQGTPLRLQCLVITAHALLSGVALGQAPAGYHLGVSIAIPDSLVEVMAGGRFRATVVRAARTQRERDLITMAERVYPESEAILKTARDKNERDELVVLADGTVKAAYTFAPRSAGNPADRWWLTHFDETWISYAITGAAVDYYLGRLRDFAAGRGRFQYGPGEQLDNGKFDYRASVRRSTKPGTAFTVTMRLHWYYWCGTMCAMEFSQTRLVDFDANGHILRVTGDERPDVEVS